MNLRVRFKVLEMFHGVCTSNNSLRRYRWHSAIQSSSGGLTLVAGHGTRSMALFWPLVRYFLDGADKETSVLIPF